MEYYGSFGSWVRRRRKLLELTQADLAAKASCSLSMLRKIETDERRPSEQLAGLLADHLAMDDSERDTFLLWARGKFVQHFPHPTQSNGPLAASITGVASRSESLPPFVARKRELQQLNDHLSKALAGQGRIVFVAGEAGRGKTSLLYAFARQALDAQLELTVAGGSSDVYTGQGDPLLPFRDIFRFLIGDIDNASLPGLINSEFVARLTRTIPVIAEILLDKGSHLIDTLVPGTALEARLARSFPRHPKTSELLFRFQGQRSLRLESSAQHLQQDRLFDEISTTLKALSQRSPLLLMLDDLHWIDHSSASLLGHLTMRLKQSPILIVGSFRPEDLAPRQAPDTETVHGQHPLQEVLSESLRQFGQNRVDLDQHEPGDALNFVNALMDVEANEIGSEFREQLASLTEGNPLFVVELLRDMRERGDLVQGDDARWRINAPLSWAHFPARVEGVIEKRIARLPDDLRDLLSVASAQGETFFAEVVAQVRSIDAVALTRRLSAALDRRHRLIQEQSIVLAGDTRLSLYRFRHHLFQKYLYGQLTEAERMYLHEAVGNALEMLYASSPEVEEWPSAQLARHFQEARRALKASQYLLLAGQKAVRLIAYDEAAAHFERGLVLLEGESQSTEIDRLAFELSLSLARALWHDGRVAEAISVYEKSIEIAQDIQDPKLLAQAVLAYEEPRWRLNLDEHRSQQQMREALEALGEEGSGLRVRLLVGLARTLLASGEQEELRVRVGQALEIARRIDDRVALCDALRISAQIDRRPESTTARLAAVQEMIVTAESIDDQERLADALDLYVYDMLELGRMDLVDKAISAQKRASDKIKQPFQMHVAAVFQTMLAIMRGEFDAAERLANDAADISRKIGLAELDGILGIHMFTIRREQGRLNEIAPVVELIVANRPDSATWRPGLALIYRNLGRKEMARAIFEDLASEGFGLLPQDSLQVASLAYLAEVCAFLEDVVRAKDLYKLLLPYDGRAVVVGGATACYGAAARFLGMLAATSSDWDAAERHFEGALALDGRMGARPWLAHSKFEYAAMCLRRGRSADRDQAECLLQEAAAAAKQMGMKHLVEKTTRLQARFELLE